MSATEHAGDDKSKYEALIRQHQQQEERREEEEEEFNFEFELTPREVKGQLDRFVISQDEAKKYLANAICYHYARVQKALNDPDSERRSIKKNVLLFGPTGVGKTYTLEILSKMVGVPFVKENAPEFTSEGYVGRSVKDILRDLYIASGNNKEHTQIGIVYLDEVDKLRGSITFSKDVNGVEVQRALLKMLEDAVVKIEVGGLMKQEVEIDTKNILFILSGAFNGLEDIVYSRLAGEEEESDNELEQDLGEVDWRKTIVPEDFVRFGLEEEFIGRLPIRCGFKPLTEEDLYKILTTSEDSPIRQYQEDFATYNIALSFTEDALREVARRAAQQATGARGIVSIFEGALVDFMYELPSTDIDSLEVDADLIKDPKGVYIDLLFDDILESYIRSFRSKYGGINLNFTRDAIEWVKDVVRVDGKPISDCLRETLEGQLATSLKALSIKEFEITQDILQDPASAYLDLTFDLSLKQYIDDFKNRHQGIELSFSEDATEYIRNAVRSNPVSVEVYLTGALDNHLAPGLSILGLRRFEVTVPVLENPADYLKGEVIRYYKAETNGKE